MRNSLLVLLLAAAVMMVAPTAAKADISYNLTVDHCTGGCGTSALNPGATVLLQDQGGGSVKVTVTLNDGNKFVNTGAGLQNTFDFNLNGFSSVSGISVATAGFSSAGNTAGSYHFDGFGDFMYSIVWGSQGGGNASNSNPLVFTVTAVGLTEGSFAQNSTGGAPSTFFGADVLSGTTGNTGPIGGGSLTSTPEPASLALFSAGLIGLGGLIRRRK